MYTARLLDMLAVYFALTLYATWDCLLNTQLTGSRLADICSILSCVIMGLAWPVVLMVKVLNTVPPMVNNYQYWYGKSTQFQVHITNQGAAVDMLNNLYTEPDPQDG